jgi:hypothetical protein
LSDYVAIKLRRAYQSVSHFVLAEIFRMVRSAWWNLSSVAVSPAPTLGGGDQRGSARKVDAESAQVWLMAPGNV